MRHAIRFEGGYERNFPKLRPGATEYEGEDGRVCPMPPWPEAATGVRYGFLEQPGKKFFVVRVIYGDEEVVLHHPVRIDPDRHMGGKRFSAEPITIDDRSAGELLGAVIDANHDQQRELTVMRDHVRDAIRAAKAH